MMNTMKRRVRQYIEDHQMICPGDTIVAGVSGGADSLCLFLLLQELAGEMGFHIHVVHVHHGLRVTAQEDLEFVQALCTKTGVPCTVVRVDAASAAKEEGIGVEEAARMLRYDAFRQVCAGLAAKSGAERTEKGKKEEKGENRDYPAPPAFRIAVAHHREDQAETVLFHLCRGTDLRGAGGMLPVNGQIIRPLLCESRADIEDYLTGRGFSWQEDETNTDTSYTRNYLRREIIPRLEEGVHAAAAQRISRFASVCAEAEEYLTAVTEKAMERCRAVCGPEDRMLIPEPYMCLSVLRLDVLLKEEAYLQGRILYSCLADSTKTGRDIGTVHVEALRDLCRKKTDGQLSMPDRITVFRSAGKLLFCREADSDPEEYPTDLQVDLQADLQTDLQTDLRSDLQADLRSDLQVDLQADLQTDLQVDLQTDLRSDLQADLRSGEQTDLKGRSCAVSASGHFRQDPRKDTEQCASTAAAGRIFPFSEGEYAVSVRDFDGSMSSIPRNECTKWFDYDKIGMFPVFRTREPGDYMRLSSGEEMITKKLARIMLDGKVPAGTRDRIVLPFMGKEALWIPGLRMGDSCKVTSATRRILEIRRNSDTAFRQNHAERGGRDGVQNSRDDQ